MIGWAEARERHGILDRAGSAVGPAVWAGITSASPGGLVGNAVSDTTPREYAALLSRDDIPAAFAASVLVEAFDRSFPTTPAEARAVALEGWTQFERLAEQAKKYAEIGEDGGGSATDAGGWARFEDVQSVAVDRAKVQRIAALAGRMKRALGGREAKTVKGIPERVCGITQGGDVKRLAPLEMALLGVPTTAADVLLRLEEHRAAVYELEGSEKQSRGPLVILLDESSSMLHGVREEFAKAAATALTQIAWAENRPVQWIKFSTVTKSLHMKKGDSRGLLRAQNSFLTGGTSMGRALHMGTKAAQQWADKGTQGGDVVLISDGQSFGEIEPQLEELKASGARLFAMAIGSRWFGPLREAAAEYVELNDHQLGVDGIQGLANAV